MHIAVLYAAAVSFDTAVFYVLSLVTALLHPLFGSNDVAGQLACMWSVSVIRWVLIWTFIQPGVNKADRAMMKRWATVHCFLGSVYESGRRAAFGGPVESGNGPFDSPGSTALTTVAAAAACVVWELTVPDPNGESDRKDGKKKAGELLMRVMCLLKPDWLILLGAFTFLLLAVLCELFALLQTGKLIDFLGSEYQWQKFPSAVFLLGVYGFGSSLCTACREGLFSCTVSRFSCRVKFRLFGSLVHQEIGFFDSTRTGEISNRLCTDTGLMGNAVSLSVNHLLRTVIELLGIASVMLGLSWKLTVLVLMETPLMSLLQSVFNVYFQVLSKEVQDSMARENDAVGEAVAGIRTVRSFSAEWVEAQRYDNRLMDTHKLKTSRQIARGVYTLLRKVSDLGMRFAVLCYGRKLVESGQMSAGTLVFFIFYQRDLGIRIKTMIYIFGDIVNSVNVAEKVFEYLDRKPLVSVGGTLQPDALKGHVHFHNLTFSYPTRPEQPVLQSLSLELKPGQMTALVGPSGGGKSTCVSLLERFYEPQEGQILLDGQPLHSYQHQYLHRKVAMVGQEPVLFSGSIRDNIAYGLKHCPLEKVQEAARRANAHSFISQLEHGYDTDVGERGGQLSAGQKQRIAIARALVREPQVLILDEVTSSLDTETEHLVLQALANCSSLTILVIAHRLKTVERADQIFLIDRGVSLERGTHWELMDTKGKYYRLQGKIFIEENPQC